MDRFGQFHDDLAERMLAVRAASPGLPLVMYGHSFGGLITAGYVLSGRDLPMPDLLVLSAPALDAEQPAWKKSLAKILTGITPKMKLANGLPKDGLSRDPAVQAAVDADPLCISTSTVRFGAESFAEQDRVQAAVAGISAMPMPTYVLHGSADPDRRRRPRARSSRARATSPAACTRACATSATTSPSTRRSSARWWPGSGPTFAAPVAAGTAGLEPGGRGGPVAAAGGVDSRHNRIVASGERHVR